MNFAASRRLSCVGRRRAGKRATSDDQPSFLAEVVPPDFQLRVVTVEPGVSRPYDEREWHDALVVIERGSIELECTRGGTRTFARGDLLWLVDLPLRVIHNRGSEPAVLIAVSRRR
jgi:hypothetical protein